MLKPFYFLRGSSNAKSCSFDGATLPDNTSTESDVIMISFPVICIFAVVKMASSGNSLVLERYQAYILRKEGFKVSQIMEIIIISKNWVCD